LYLPPDIFSLLYPPIFLVVLHVNAFLNVGTVFSNVVISIVDGNHLTRYITNDGVRWRCDGVGLGLFISI
jgi:hypothetical protein